MEAIALEKSTHHYAIKGACIEYSYASLLKSQI